MLLHWWLWSPLRGTSQEWTRSGSWSHSPRPARPFIYLRSLYTSYTSLRYDAHLETRRPLFNCHSVQRHSVTAVSLNRYNIIKATQDDSNNARNQQTNAPIIGAYPRPQTSFLPSSLFCPIWWDWGTCYQAQHRRQSLVYSAWSCLPCWQNTPRSQSLGVKFELGFNKFKNRWWYFLTVLVLAWLDGAVVL